MSEDMTALETALTAEQAAEILGLTSARVRQFVRAGKLHGVKLAETWFFTPQAIEEFKKVPRAKAGRPKKKA
ncbi:hypothetical protein BH10CHL1_BH10CHL1_17920 [soil metagenome]